MECLACHAPNTEGARFCAKCGAPLPVVQASATDALIGTVIGGRYTVTHVIGEGGMGKVYAAEQRMGTSIRKVAIKTLHATTGKEREQYVARFMREVGTVSELEHPNTIKVYDFGQIDGTSEFYIAMELLQGLSLEEALQSGPMQPERVDRIIGQVCGSLQEAHDKGIVHRDLKPANIFLTTRAGEEDVVKVLDFGIAKRGEKDSKNEAKLTQQGTILGTPPYMSPEQFGGGELTARSDIYSLAIVTYEMLTGKLPFEADTPWEWMTQHMSVQPFPFEAVPLGGNVPPKMRAAVMRALDKRAENRPATVREFFSDLTLGSVRMSLLDVGGQSSGGTSSLQFGGAASSGSNRSGQTQMGEPLFPEAPYQGGTTAPGRTMLDAMPAHQPGIPTGGGQVFAPPPPAQKQGGSGAILAIVGVLVLGAAGGGGYYFLKVRPAASGDDGSPTFDVKPKKPTAETEESETEDSKTSAGSGTTGTGTPTTADPIPTETPSGTATVAPTNTATTPTATHTTGPVKSQAGFACCGSLKGKDRSICSALSANVQAGKAGRAEALASLNAATKGASGRAGCR